MDFGEDVKNYGLRTRLTLAGYGLEKIIGKEDLNEEDKKMLGWFGDLWGSVDWNSKYPRREYDDSAGLTQEIRHYFLNLCPRLFKDKEYSERIYSLLTNPSSYTEIEEAEITEIKKFIYALEKELTPVGDTPLSKEK